MWRTLSVIPILLCLIAAGCGDQSEGSDSAAAPAEGESASADDDGAEGERVSSAVEASDQGRADEGARSGSGRSAVPLGAILEEPGRFGGERVRLEGHFANVCCEGCFVYKEGVDAVEVRGGGDAWRRFSPADPVSIDGVVRVVERRTADGGTRRILHVEADRVERR